MPGGSVSGGPQQRGARLEVLRAAARRREYVPAGKRSQEAARKASYLGLLTRAPASVEGGYEYAITEAGRKALAEAEA